MCFFLTVAVPAKHADRISEVFGRGFQTHASTNPSVTAAFPVGYEARLVTSGMCSCDLYARPGAAAASDPAAHLRRKYERLGWSEAKIQRALEQAVASASKLHRPTSGFRDDVTERLGALCRAAGSVAFVVHWYNGDVQTERLPLHRAKPCDCDELRTRAQQLAEDAVLIASTRRAD
jgi:hypothetical protein